MSDKNIQITKAAIRLFAKDGISVPTSKIAKEAGISNGTLFNYFETKQDLIDGVYLCIKEKMANEVMNKVDLSAEMKGIFYDVWKFYISWARKHPLEHQVVDLLKTSQMLSEEVKEVGENLFIAIDEAMEKGIENKIIADIPMQYLCELAAAHLKATISYADNNGLKKSELDDLVSTSFEIYWNGIKQI